MNRSQEAAGLFQKYIVVRGDGRDRPGEKHVGCQYFVLDLTHDPAARQALSAYKNAIWNRDRELAEDINRLLFSLERETAR